MTKNFENKIFIQPMVRLSMHSKCFDFFLLSFGWVGEDFFIFHLFPSVPNLFPGFPMCSPRVFPIAPHFNPIYFAQSPPLLTYIGGPKGEALHLSIESSILGSLHCFNFFFFVMGQSNWFIAKRNRVGLMRHPPTN